MGYSTLFWADHQKTWQVRKIDNIITFKIQTGYYLKILTPETMEILGRAESKITKDKNGESEPHSKITELVLVHCNIVNNDYQHNSGALYIFVSNNSFGQLSYVSPKKFINLRFFNSEFSEIEVWFTDQNSKPLEIEKKKKIALVIN